MNKLNYDVIIIGGGPAGLSAALYTRRAGLSTLIIEKMIVGGQMNLIHSLDNYVGLPGITGSDLADQMYAQVQQAGAEFLFDEISQVDLANKVITTPESILQARIVILATGAGPRKTGAKNESLFLNNGVHYCATCDGPLYRGQDVVVVGGNAQALEDALFLASICRSVTIVNPATDWQADSSLTKAIAEQPNVTVLHHCQVTEIGGNQKINHVMVSDLLTQTTQTIHCDGIFVAIGRVPNIDLVYGQIELAADGYVQTNHECQTNLPGVYAIGDVRSKSCRQVATAVADGATAGTAAAVQIKMQGATSK